MNKNDTKLDYEVARQNLIEFKSLSITDLPKWIDQKYLSLTPFAFSAYDFPSMRRAISEELKVEYHDIWCTGSGALGFSLNPNKISQGNPKLFDKTSDLDIAIVSTHDFDQAWRELRESNRSHLFGAQTRYGPISDIDNHKTKIFDGAIKANKLFGSIESGRKWQIAVSNLSVMASKMFERNIEASFWIYRDTWSVRNYAANSARITKGQL